MSSAVEMAVVDRPSRDAWRQFVLNELVTYLSEHREQIVERYHRSGPDALSPEQLEEEGLMDFELAVTFLRDRQGWGQGKGFLGMNLIG